MRILAVADETSRIFYENYQKGMLDEYDIIVACGDLERPYLEFLVTMARCPVLYVHGNHDAYFEVEPPEGCVCIEDRIYTYKGVRFLGLGGSYRYLPDRPFMYTEKEMKRRIKKLGLTIWKNKGFDVLVTHAPAKGLGDLEDLPHRGFQCFIDLIEEYKPKLMLHGHVHKNYGIFIPKETVYLNTTIVNASGYQQLDLYISEENEQQRKWF